MVVCSISDLPDGTMRAFEVAGRPLLLVRHGEKVYALRNVCPHQGAQLSGGVLTCSRGTGGVGEYRAEKGGRIIRCPWHNWAFDARDGSALHAPDKVRVATYPARLEGDAVCVILDSGASLR